MKKEFPFRALMWSRDWTPSVWAWLRNLEPGSWRRWKDPIDFGDTTPELEFDFKNEEDATAFTLTFKK